MRELNVTPHVTQNVSRLRSAVNGRTTRHEGYWASRKAASPVGRPSTEAENEKQDNFRLSKGHFSATC